MSKNNGKMKVVINYSMRNEWANVELHTATRSMAISGYGNWNCLGGSYISTAREKAQRLAELLNCAVDEKEVK